MPTIHVCPLSRLDDIVLETRASHLVTLVKVGTPFTRPVAIAEARHLSLFMSDIVEPMDGHVLPGPEHVEPFLAFVREWDRTAPMVIHCWAGISRSTAGAFVAACALAPERDEATIARALRAASPMATPNKRIVAVADALLGREGRMVEAIAAIGRGEDAYEGVPFTLSLRD
ncbi:tyrosine phosphatase family protein [Salinarimonas ramus]|uniref:Protein-tyrosine-phosphatase n=1 Tax=Salinarimonas ramus TaxID=690164 RepID=A0A917Q7Q5_9HYPH|nr:tyrosine phosphatase family protein [Salinarimonas ramus]GGK34738.1 protein-tyrosine-phosphatase [Salinarimonas ramus]